MASYKKFMMVFQISWKMSEVNTFIFNLDIFSANMEEEKTVHFYSSVPPSMKFGNDKVHFMLIAVNSPLSL